MKVCIIGLGYVGLPLAMLFSQKHEVVGFDVDEEKLKMLERDCSYITDVSTHEIIEAKKRGFVFTSSEEKIKDCGAYIICVPTPVDERNVPDLSCMISSAKSVSRVLKKGDLVTIESTTYPGTTEEVMVPLFEESGLVAGNDFFVAYSPERVDPNNRDWRMENIPKLVGGINKVSCDSALRLYSSVMEKIIPVSDCRTAEAAKITENIFRATNIALMNELCIIFEKMGIDTWEVIRAASTKPFGFMPFFPGPGVGGHCIPVDPYYLSWKAKKIGFFSKFIEMSGEINDYMKLHVSYLILKALNGSGVDVEGSRIVLYGASYKKDISDTRMAPAGKICDILMSHGANVIACDPLVRSFKNKHGIVHVERNIYEAAREADCLVFLINHEETKEFDFERMGKIMKNRIIVDARNVVENPPEGFAYHGLGKRVYS